MTTRRWSSWAATGAVLTAAACQGIAGLGDFQPDPGPGGGGGRGTGGDAPTSVSQGAGGGGAGSGGGTTSSTSQSTSVASTAETSAASTGTGTGCTLDHLVISEVRTRGQDDGNQDFVELFNPTASAVTLTSDFHLDARGEASGSYGVRWTGDGTITIPPGGHALFANDAVDNPLGTATPDATYDSGIPDGASVVLYSGSTVIDAVCFTCASAALDEGYVCERPELSRSGSCSTDGDVSVQRKPVGAVDGCADTDDNAADLAEAPSTPQGTAD